MEWSEGGKWDNCNSIINKVYLKTKIKNKLGKQSEQEQNHREIIWKVISWERERREWRMMCRD